MSGRSGFSRRLLVLVALIVAAGEASLAEFRHVVLISVDTLRRDHLTPYGYERDTSPNLARLAEEGVVFDTAIAVQTTTGPSHTTMLTGLYPAQHGAVDNAVPIADGVATIAERLSAAGIRTAAFVSAVPLTERFSGLSRGFEHYDEETDSQQPASQTCGRVRAWLPKAKKKDRLFLLVHLFDPHSYYDAPEPYASRFPPADDVLAKLPRIPDRRRISLEGARPGEIEEYVRRYDAEIVSADRCVGDLVALLRERRYLERTLLIFTADHGESLGERYWPFSHGNRLFDEQIRIPLVLHGVDEPRRVRRQVHHVDIAPTILDAFGIAVPEEWSGRSLLERPDRGRAVFSLARPLPDRMPEGRGYVAEGRVRSIRRPPYKLVRYPTQDGYHQQLFDLVRDPGERRDLSEEKPEIAAALARELDAWEREVLDGAEAEVPVLSPEDREKLRSLGYIR